MCPHVSVFVSLCVVTVLWDVSGCGADMFGVFCMFGVSGWFSTSFTQLFYVGVWGRRSPKTSLCALQFVRVVVVSSHPNSQLVGVVM